MVMVCGVEESSFPGSAPLSDTFDSESMVDVKPGNSSMVMIYQLINLLPPGWQNILLLGHAFVLLS